MFKKLIYLSLISFALITLITSFILDRNYGKTKTPRPQPIESKVSTPQSYQLVTQIFRNRNTKITFPQLKNFSDSSKQKVINLLIKHEALRIRHFYSETGEDYHLDITYKINLKSTKFLSIQYSGVGYTQGAAYPNNWFYTTNLNLHAGRRLRLKELVKLDAGLVAQLKSNQSTAMNPEHQKIIDNLTTEELLKRLRAADPLNWKGDAATFSYLTKDALGISLSVLHVLGDHAEFEVKDGWKWQS